MSHIPAVHSLNCSEQASRLSLAGSLKTAARIPDELSFCEVDGSRSKKKGAAGGPAA